MAKKNLANNKVILAMGVGIAAMLAMPMYANAEEIDNTDSSVAKDQLADIESSAYDESVDNADKNSIR